jgi:hypothetical protein
VIGGNTVRVRERTFQPGELGAVIQFVANPHLFKDAAAVKKAIDTWALRPAQVLNGAGRVYSGRASAPLNQMRLARHVARQTTW